MSKSLQDLFSVNMSSAIDSLQIFQFDSKANMFTFQSLSELAEDVQKTVFEFSRDIRDISFYLSKEVVIDFVKIDEKVLFGSCILYGRRGSGRRSLVSSKNIFKIFNRNRRNRLILFATLTGSSCTVFLASTPPIGKSFLISRR